MRFPDGCDGAVHEGNWTISYFQSLGYLQTVMFTIGYGHITPLCVSGKVYTMNKTTMTKHASHLTLSTSFQIYTFVFAYVTIPLVAYTLALAGRLIAEAVL